MRNTIPTLGTVSWERRRMPATIALGLLLVFGLGQPALAQNTTDQPESGVKEHGIRL